MGEAKRRGTREERVSQAVNAARLRTPKKAIPKRRPPVVLTSALVNLFMQYRLPDGTTPAEKQRELQQRVKAPVVIDEVSDYPKKNLTPEELERAIKGLPA